VTDRYTKAIEQLGLGQARRAHRRFYALERVARDSAKDHPTVMEVLTAFIREHSREQWPPSDAGQPVQEGSTRPDVQAAVTAVGRRDAERDILVIDLAAADLTRANLTFVHLARASLAGANLTGAHLANATLFGADLTGATLVEAFLPAANLTRATLSAADLTDADLTGRGPHRRGPLPHRRGPRRRGPRRRGPRRRQVADGNRFRKAGR
jgi:Pentapeptide repeats (8 copies)